jgi:hypothetical protein
MFEISASSGRLHETTAEVELTSTIPTVAPTGSKTEGKILIELESEPPEAAPLLANDPTGLVTRNPARRTPVSTPEIDAFIDTLFPLKSLFPRY